MKVAFCSSPLQSGHKTRGIGSYTRNLLQFLQKREDVEIEEFTDINQIKHTDIVHYPFFDLFQRTLPLRKKFRTVVTIHDVTPLVFAEFYPSGIRGSLKNLWQKLALRNIGAVITDSRTSERDIVKYLGVKAEKVFGVYLAASEVFHPIKDLPKLRSVKHKFRLPDRFVVYVGSVNWNKNLLNLTEGALRAGVEIVFMGGDFKNRTELDHPEKRSFREFLQRYSNNPKVHILGFVSEDDLIKVLSLAECLLLPSFYEGFGLPILEAQSCGVPVVTGDVSSMPEVAGRGALLVDPYNPAGISQAIREVSENKMLRRKLTDLGFENVKKFSWEKTAEETVKVYQQVMAAR